MTSTERPFLAASALLFAASTAATIAMGASMSSMGGMPMPGGWTMSMTWMRMPGQTWTGAAASFLGMWSVMMVAMMLPSLVPALLRHRRAGGRRTARIAAAYFAVWTAVGAIAFPLGCALATLEMRAPALARAVPFAIGAVVVIAGLVQHSAWKARLLAGCRAATGCSGLRLGLHCVACCLGPTAILLVLGVMDLRAMALVTVAITLERLGGPRIARATGAIAIAAGLLLLLRAL